MKNCSRKQHKLANFVSPGIKTAAYRSQTIACSSRTAEFTVKGKKNTLKEERVGKPLVRLRAKTQSKMQCTNMARPSSKMTFRGREKVT